MGLFRFVEINGFFLGQINGFFHLLGCSTGVYSVYVRKSPPGVWLARISTIVETVDLRPACLNPYKMRQKSAVLPSVRPVLETPIKWTPKTPIKCT